MNIPNPKRANELVKEFIANAELEKELLKERLKKEAEINNAAELKVTALLKDAFQAALKGESEILVNFDEVSPTDVLAREKLTGKGFCFETNAKKIEYQKGVIQKYERIRQNNFSDYANSIHRLRMHVYDRIINHHKQLINGEIIASEILPLIFDSLKLETCDADYILITNTLDGWSKLFNTDYVKLSPFEILTGEDEDAKISNVAIATLADSGNYDYVKSKTTASLGSSFSKNVKDSLKYLGDVVDIGPELASEKADLNELEKNPDEYLFIGWFGASVFFGKENPDAIDASTLDWISNDMCTGTQIIKDLNMQIESAAKNGSESLTLPARWFDDEQNYASRNEISFIFKELGFKVSPANNGIEISWS